MQATALDIRPMRRNEVSLAVEWAAKEGWNPGLYDAESFFAADPEGFLVGERDGKPVAVISAVRYGEGFGFLGFYIVAPEYRGRGYGLQIWNAAMVRLRGRNIGLDGVMAQQENYRKSGFRLAYRNIRYEGRGSGEAGQTVSGIVPLSEVAFSALEAYDRTCFPEARRAFLQTWISRPRTLALGLTEGVALQGYGVIRPCRSGYKIGPLFADDAPKAEVLFRALIASVPQGETFYLDIPEPNAEALALVQKYGMEVVFETARMYTGTFPVLAIARVFGVTTFELG